MKQQILLRYTELCEKSHFHSVPQVKTYLSSEKEEDKDLNIEIVNLPYPGNIPENFNFKLEDKDIQPISIAYMSSVSNIEKLDLSFNRLTDKGASVLSKLLEYADNIKIVNLKGNLLTDNSCESMNKGLKGKAKLEYLNLHSNKFGNVGLMSINELLFKNPALTYLNVGANRYEWDGIISILSALKTTNNTLKVLNLDDPEYKKSEQHFFNHFGKMFLSNTGLQKLSLKFNKIRWEGINLIIYSLVNNTSLTVLDLTGNEICFQGMIYVRDYLKKNNVLKSLILAGNKLRDRGIKVLSEGLPTNNTLVHLDVTNNDIGDEGFVEFAEKLKGNNGIKSLKLFRDNHWHNNEKSIEKFDEYLKLKGKEFYPDFTIYEDDDGELNIAYLETHIPGEEEYLIEE